MKRKYSLNSCWFLALSFQRDFSLSIHLFMFSNPKDLKMTLILSYVIGETKFQSAFILNSVSPVLHQSLPRFVISFHRTQLNTHWLKLNCDSPTNMAHHSRKYRRGVNEIKVKAQMECHKSEEETSSSHLQKMYAPSISGEQCQKRVKTHLCWRSSSEGCDWILMAYLGRMIARRLNGEAFGGSIIIEEETHWT